VIRQFGAGQTTASRVVLLATLNRLRARNGRKVSATRVARFLYPRRKVTTTTIRSVAAANPTLVTDDGSGNLTLTSAGLRAARSRMSPRYAIKA